MSTVRLRTIARFQEPARQLDTVVAVAALPFTAAGAYLALLAGLARPSRQGPRSDEVRLSVVVPAHDEAADIADTVASLLAMDYPVDRRRIVVIADNCTDDTATLARSAGAEVIERVDPYRRGKGFALDHAFGQLLADEWTDAVVVVDADTVVDRDLLRSLAGRLAAGELVVQADYQVRNPEDSWRTRLLHIAFTAFHEVRSSGRERVGASCGLRGNGMAFSREALTRVPHDAHSIVEDLEYGIRLGQAGVRVAYAGDVAVHGKMPADGDSAKSQRARWEQGRAQLRRRDGGRLVAQALRRRDPVLLDLAADLWVPPIGQIVSALGIGLVAGLATGQLAGRQRASWVNAAGLLGVGAHVARGWQRSGTGAAGLLDLARAPVYVGWKLLDKVSSRAAGGPSAPAEWVRTARTPNDHLTADLDETHQGSGADADSAVTARSEGAA